ncbi:MAG: DUF4339 domain-containing protein [Alphaproteobacteria bacterium]|nr:DUF4339 domain-containing protein [Alphaproteobacteria bacterium]
MSIWHFTKDGQQIGPLSMEDSIEYAQNNSDALAWKNGMAEWEEVSNLPEFSAGGIYAAPSPAPVKKSDEVDYEIFGDDIQFVEIELDPDETVVSEAGAMMFKEPSIKMETIFGDGSEKVESKGIVGKLLSAGTRVMTGESLFITAYTHEGVGKAKIAFAAPFPGKIIPVYLPDVGGTLICQKDSFLCAAKGVSVSLHFQKKILTALFGGEGFIMQKLEGDGMIFAHAGGTITEKVLAPGEELHVDTGCIVAMSPDVQFDIIKAGGIKTMLFGGEGLFFASLKGPGKVWLQSLPFSRLAGRMMMAAYGGKGEGSAVNFLGDK